MADNSPDLVQRAAARLQRIAPSPLSTQQPAEKQLRGSVSAHFEAIAPTRSPEPRPGANLGRGPQVTVSPTSLAANGVSVPSGGVSRTVEEFRSLKRQLFAKAREIRGGIDSAPNRVILVTSARTGDGKTFTAVNLALALAYEKDTRVLLIDADAYRQSLLKFLGISADVGWLDVVSQNNVSLEETLLRTNIAGLSILPAGKMRAEIPEIMSSRQMKQLLSDLARDDPGRYIVIDSLPCLTSTEPAILAALAGQTIFVVAAHETSREDVESSLRLLSSSPSVSLVLNKVEPLLSEQFKGYGYAYAHQT